MSFRQTSTTRRAVLVGTVAGLVARSAFAASESLNFNELYGKETVLGLEFSDKVRRLSGKAVAVRGFMAPPLKAEAKFFVLTKTPMALCPFCSSDADWPNDILVVYLDEKRTFVPPSKLIEVAGVLEFGSWTDPETGFVSLLRLRHSTFETV